ncbi:MAG: DUF2934 domain-containing protein [Bdellovibrionales bacterium]|nr:DUF2934 domain-containing protein [Bdellovibrionales bacterium]
MSKLPSNVDLIDPLGEIRARAKELWKDAGSPEGTDWTEFFEEAERQMCGGSGGGEIENS